MQSFVINCSSTSSYFIHQRLYNPTKFFLIRDLTLSSFLSPIRSPSSFFLSILLFSFSLSQRGFMSTIADDYNRSIAKHSVNRRRSTEAYRRVMFTWPSMMVGTAEGDLPKLFSPALANPASVLSLKLSKLNYIK